MVEISSTRNVSCTSEHLKILAAFEQQKLYVNKENVPKGENLFK